MKKGFLTFLATAFNTVEVNSSFYHLPLASTFTKWKNETPDDFVFAVKLSRYITHELRLQGARKAVVRFLRRAKRLDTKLGPILVQLPPFLRYDETLITKFIADLEHANRTLKSKARFALEPRHASWMEPENAARLRTLTAKARIALVFPHSAVIPSFRPEAPNITTDFVYVRFHGPSEFAASLYGSRRLLSWAKRIHTWLRAGLSVFIYFNNDVHGHAVHDAKTLKRLVGRFTKSTSVSRHSSGLSLTLSRYAKKQPTRRARVRSQSGAREYQPKSESGAGSRQDGN